MADTSWKVEGEYFETCNCDYVCPCIPGNLAVKPTHGNCLVPFAFNITKGNYGNVQLDGLSFVVAVNTPGPMMDGNWTVGLIVDEKASAEQQEAITAIASGQAGGPMAALGPLIGNFAGVEIKPITFKVDGLTRSVSIPGMLEQSCEGVTSPAFPDEPMVMDKTMHPVNARIAMAKSKGSHVHVFGLDWDSDGGTNALFAPFSWQAA